jgi:hypothetical protein
VTLPPLPKTIPSQLGPVRVKLVKRVGKKGKLMGRYSMEKRVIEVCSRASRRMQWQTLYHEWMHMVLMDVGLHNVLGLEQQEVLCDTVGTARVAEMLAGG